MQKRLILPFLPLNLLLFLFLVLSSYDLEEISGGIKHDLSIVRDISYGKDVSRYHKLDIYYHPKERDLPVFIFIHRGGWVGGDKSQRKQQAIKMAKNGLVFVSVNYRLSPAVQSFSSFLKGAI